MYASFRLAYKNSTTKSSLFMPILQLNGKKFESLNEGRATRWKECGFFNDHKEVWLLTRSSHTGIFLCKK